MNVKKLKDTKIKKNNQENKKPQFSKLKPWSHGPVSSRKSQKKKHFKADYPLFHWLRIG